jgi:predicted nucleotide-binding protein (sugar kinase/HSP70/actin superfamily)
MVGEIYVLLEPSVNLGIEERLNYLGCIVERSLYLYDWLCETALPLWLQPKSCQEVMRKSREYIPLCIGGHARQTVGAARDFADRGFDGVVHLMPFACTPEIVSSSILPKIASSQDMPILSLSIDEQTAEVNIQTRLEAFVDLMRGRRQEISR